MIYLDHNATTPIAPSVLEAMLPYFGEHYGNPGSVHAAGRRPAGALDCAREQVADFLGCGPEEVVFTSGGTEAINLALRGVFEAFPSKRHLVTTVAEHSAVLAAAEWLKAHGAEVSFLGLDGEGRLDLAEFEAAIRPETALVSITAAHHETGVRFPVAEAAALVRARGTLLHVDAVQAAGKLDLDVARLGADLLSLGAHKFHGPKGAGALYVRRGVRLKPLVVGGSQERGRRGGTENVPALVGLGEAARLAGRRMAGWSRVEALRDGLEASLLGSVPGSRVNGRGAPRLANTSLLSFAGIEGEALLLKLDAQGICVSVGSACTSGQRGLSPVLRAMGVPPEFARGTIRISLGLETTESEVAQLLSALPAAVAGLRVPSA